MKRKQISEILLDDYTPVNFAAGYGTRPSSVIMKKQGRAHYLVKSSNNSLGELRSEVCASAIGKVFNFPVQEADLVVLSADLFFELQKQHGFDGSTIVVMSKIDVRRKRDEDNNLHDLETMLHGADLIDQVTPGFTGLELRTRRKFYTIENIDNAISFFQDKHPEADSIKQEFFNMIAFDALIGGTERHSYNWGVLLSIPDNKYLRFVKYFDNGASLLWNLNRNKKIARSTRTRVLFSNLREKFMNKGKSIIRMNNGKKYDLFKLCLDLIDMQYCTRENLIHLIDSLSLGTSETKLKHAIIGMMPIDERFEMTENSLGWVYNYVNDRRKRLIFELNKQL